MLKLLTLLLSICINFTYASEADISYNDISLLKYQLNNVQNPVIEAFQLLPKSVSKKEINLDSSVLENAYKISVVIDNINKCPESISLKYQNKYEKKLKNLNFIRDKIDIISTQVYTEDKILSKDIFYPLLKILYGNEVGYNKKIDSYSVVSFVTDSKLKNANVIIVNSAQQIQAVNVVTNNNVIHGLPVAPYGVNQYIADFSAILKNDHIKQFHVFYKTANFGALIDKISYGRISTYYFDCTSASHGIELSIPIKKPLSNLSTIKSIEFNGEFQELRSNINVSLKQYVIILKNKLAAIDDKFITYLAPDQYNYFKFTTFNDINSLNQSRLWRKSAEIIAVSLDSDNDCYAIYDKSVLSLTANTHRIPTNKLNSFSCSKSSEFIIGISYRGSLVDSLTNGEYFDFSLNGDDGTIPSVTLVKPIVPLPINGVKWSYIEGDNLYSVVESANVIEKLDKLPKSKYSKLVYGVTSDSDGRVISNSDITHVNNDNGFIDLLISIPVFLVLFFTYFFGTSQHIKKVFYFVFGMMLVSSVAYLSTKKLSYIDMFATYAVLLIFIKYNWCSFPGKKLHSIYLLTCILFSLFYLVGLHLLASSCLFLIILQAVYDSTRK